MNQSDGLSAMDDLGSRAFGFSIDRLHSLTTGRRLTTGHAFYELDENR